MHHELIEAALGISDPWYGQGVDFDAAGKTLTIAIDFVAGSRFAHTDAVGLHPVHDTIAKRYRHLNFFQHESFLEVRTPRMKLPDGRVVLVELAFACKLTGFTLLFEGLVLAMCQKMPFAAGERLVGECWHRVHAICARYVGLAVAKADLSKTTAVAIDETSRERGHKYLTVIADALERKVTFVAPGRDGKTIADFRVYLRAHRADPAQITLASIDMSPAFIKGVTEHLPNARITFDKFDVIPRASTAIEKTRRLEQKTDLVLKGLRWALLKDRRRLLAAQRADLDALNAQATTKHTARAWLYKEHLRAILDRKQINIVSAMLRQWCTNAMRFKIEPMKEVAHLIRNHFEGIIAWPQTRQTNGVLEAINGLFQAAKRKARGYVRFATMRTVLFLTAGKLNFARINPHAALPT